MQEHGAHPVCHSSSLNNPLPILALGVHLPTGTPFTKYEVLLDNQAGASLFKNADLLTEVRKATRGLFIGGVDSTGAGLRTHTIGTFGDVGTVYVHEKSTANIISQTDQIDKGGRVCFATEEDFYTLTPFGSTVTFHFGRKATDDTELAKHYTCDAREYMPHLRGVLALPMTVSDNKRLYTVRERKGAERARQLIERMGHPPAAMASKMVGTGVINCDVTAQDIERSRRIYGKDIAELKGRTTKKTPVAEDIDLSADTTQQAQGLHLDIMWVKGMAFLLGVLKPLGFTLVSFLTNGRSAIALAKAIREQVSHAARRRFQVRELRCDGEGGVHALREELSTEGVNVEGPGPGQHVPVAENRIKTIKERVRIYEHKLPYIMTFIMLIWCVYFVTSRFNMQYTVAHPHGPTPREQFVGRKVNATLDLRHDFGDYAQVTVPMTDNTMNARTWGAIALAPTGNATGSSHFYHLATGKVIVRDQFDLLPVPDVVITAINKQAAKDGMRRGDDDPSIDRAGAQPDTEQTEAEAVKLPERMQLPTDQPPPEPSPAIERRLNPIRDCEQAVQAPTAAEVRGGHGQREARDDADGESGDEGWVIPVYDDEVEEDINVQVYLACVRQFVFVAKQNLSVNKALRMHGEVATKSIEAELMNVHNKGTWKPILRNALTHEQRRAVIRSSMFLREKFFASGPFEKIKARLVAGGDQQDRELYEDLSSPTVAAACVMAVSAIAAHERRTVITIDIGGAFLNASMPTDTGVIVHMRLDAKMTAILVRLLPEYAPFVDAKGELVVRLNKCLYGCLESALAWYRDLRGTLEGDSYVVNVYDPCVFNKKDQEGTQCTVTVHVDDLKATSVNDEMLEQLVCLLKRVYKEIAVHRGKKHDYLGITHDYSTPGQVKLTMERIVETLMNECGVAGHAVTPATDHLFNVRPTAVKLDKDQAEWFHRQVMRVMYLAKRARPDCLTTVAFLSTRVTKSDVDDSGKLVRLLKYLRATRERGVVLNIGSKGIVVTQLVDAAYGVHEDGKSHTGSVVMIGDGAVVQAKSSKQKIVVKSSTEGELVGLSDSANNGIHMMKFIQAQGYQTGPLVLLQDNLGTIALVKKGRSTSERSRHIDIRHFWLKDRIDIGDVVVEHLPGEEMGAANMLSKPLQGAQFQKEREDLTHWGEA
jgi:hypothetical protein